MAQPQQEHVHHQSHQSFYEILKLEPTASLQDIKKSYRRLALLYHPDRNPPEKQEQATVQFRLVNEAYEVLSDPEQRRQYDAELKYGATSRRPGSTAGGTTTSSNRFHPRYQTTTTSSRRTYRDPFAQFDDLFQNDPFFHEAFKDMEDQFAKTFQRNHNDNRDRRNPPEQQLQQQQQQPKSWGRWIADCLGIDFQVTTSRTNIGLDGRPTTSRSSTHYGGGGGNARTYTSKSTRTVIENGQRVTIQSLERDGNKIEEKYINNQMVQRFINGIPEQQYKLDAGRADL